MSDYTAPDWEAILDFNGLGGFDRLWQVPLEWVESPNAGRGGASGVGRLTLKTPRGGEVVVYIKRQIGHTRRTWRRPLQGEPTFAREFEMLRRLCRHQGMAPRPVYFGERAMGGKAAAILVTEALSGFKALDACTGEPGLQRHAQRRALLNAVAGLVRAMHAMGIQHRSLYEKHIFVRPAGEGYAAAVIDLEKSRISRLGFWSTILDLSTLNYRSPGWTRSSRLYFFKQYLARDALGFWQRLQCKLILMRSASRLKRLNRLR